MSLTEIYLTTFLIGTIGTLSLAVIVGVSSRRYRRELMESGGAQTTLGSIGCVYLEGKARVLVGLSIGILSWLMLSGGLLLLFPTPLSSSQIMIFLFVLVIACLFLLAWLFLGPRDGKARLVVRRVMGSYWSHRNEEILRRELVVLSEGDETQRRALERIAERGCKASLVAREIIEGTARPG